MRRGRPFFSRLSAGRRRPMKARSRGGEAAGGGAKPPWRSTRGSPGNGGLFRMGGAILGRGVAILADRCFGRGGGGTCGYLGVVVGSPFTAGGGGYTLRRGEGPGVFTWGLPQPLAHRGRLRRRLHHGGDRGRRLPGPEGLPQRPGRESPPTSLVTPTEEEPRLGYPPSGRGLTPKLLPPRASGTASEAAPAPSAPGRLRSGVRGRSLTEGRGQWAEARHRRGRA